MSARSKVSRRGTTLVELLIGASLLIGIAGVVSTATLSAGRVQSRASAQRALDLLARRTVERIADELRTARADGLSPQPFAPLGSSSLTYERNDGWQGGAVEWSAPCTIEERPAPGDEGYGLDADGDGRVDPGFLVWTSEDETGVVTRAVWVEGVSELAEGELANGIDDDGDGLIDERGLSFELEGDRLRIRLSLERRLTGGELLTATAETAIGLEN